jgi:hypothetical protein
MDFREHLNCKVGEYSDRKLLDVVGAQVEDADEDYVAAAAAHHGDHLCILCGEVNPLWGANPEHTSAAN